MHWPEHKKRASHPRDFLNCHHCLSQRRSLVAPVAVINVGFILGDVFNRKAISRLAKAECLIGIMISLLVIRTKSNMDEMVETSLISAAVVIR